MTPDSTTSPSIRKVRDALAAHGRKFEVMEFPSRTRTAAEAAAAIGCSVAQIAKSIVFRTVKEKKPVMVIASGANRVNESRVAELLGEAIEKADADYVRARTGFVIGGVPPIGHTEAIHTIIDEDLLKLGELWAAAGTPNSVFKLSAASLVEMTGAAAKPIK